MNHAVDMESIIRYAEYGKGIVCASIGRKGEFGFNENLKPYEYDLNRARALMKKAGYEKGFSLRVFATDTTETVMQMVKEDLMDINIRLELEIVPTLDYIQRAPFMSTVLGIESAAEYDIAAWLVDNPVINMLFNCDTLMLSTLSHIAHTPYHYPEYEAKHNWANVSDPAEHEKRLKALDLFIHDNAYFLFTYQRVLTSAVRKNVHIKKLNLNGHLEYGMLTETTKD
jgi:ABC-type transport system substrate-binding protein